MKTQELQIHSITEVKQYEGNKAPNAYEVDYSICDENGTADCTQVITKAALTKHASDTAMNVWNNGEEQVVDDLFTYMQDNYELVIEDFILTHAVV